MNMDDDRDLYATELKEMLRQSISREVNGFFSAHQDDPVFFTREPYPMKTKIDDLPLYPKRIPEVISSWAKLSTGAFRPEDVLVLDLETTGLGRGGTLAFMIGLGYFEDAQFFVEQIFLPDPDAEEHSFERLQELMRDRSLLITFNGKSFDVPVLESRLLYHQIWLNLREMEHLDVLHIARRLWKRKLPSCALETIEFYILGHIRDQELDIQGGDVPQTYYNFLTTGDAELIRRVFVHNHHDILHTAALFALICDGCEYPLKQGRNPLVDYHALARLYQSQGKDEIARRILVDLLAEGEISADIAYDLGMIYKRSGEPTDAIASFEIGASLNHVPSLVEAAKLLEKEKLFQRALEFAALALHLESGRMLLNHKQIAELQKRHDRLSKKLSSSSQKSS
ncbi:MAG: ribonuclease H-like domain-containing protein [Candidatus Cloacimonetes bacterium]|nr:ribonuclease H-like domain-containing protein [Candidatus Cloacimonadota bacterium]